MIGVSDDLKIVLSNFIGTGEELKGLIDLVSTGHAHKTFLNDNVHLSVISVDGSITDRPDRQKGKCDTGGSHCFLKRR